MAKQTQPTNFASFGLNANVIKYATIPTIPLTMPFTINIRKKFCANACKEGTLSTVIFSTPICYHKPIGKGLDFIIISLIFKRAPNMH